MQNQPGQGRIIRMITLSGWLAALLLLWLSLPRNICQMVGMLAASYLLFWGAVAAVGTGTLATWRLRFLSATIAFAFSLLLFEIPTLLGADYRLLLGTLGDEPWRNPANRLDDELFHLHQPNSHFQGVQRGGDIAFYVDIPDPNDYPFDVRTDSLGFRNDQDFQSAPVVVIGDSFIEATTVAFDDILTSQLRRELGKPVVNLGQIWYGPQQELVVLERYALPLKPEVCVWAFFEGNDLSDFRRYEQMKANWPAFAASLHSFRQRAFLRNSLLAAFQLLGRPGNRDSGDTIRGDCGPGERPMYFYYRSQTLSEEDQRTLVDVERVFRRAFEICQQHGVQFVVAFVPTKYRVYRDFCSFSERSVYRFWQPNPLPTLMQTMLEGISSEISYVDLTGPLVEATASGVQTYFSDDTHWTNEGNKVAAQAIAAALQQPKE